MDLTTTSVTAIAVTPRRDIITTIGAECDRGAGKGTCRTGLRPDVVADHPQTVRRTRHHHGKRRIRT